MRIGILGAGRLGLSLTLLLERAGHTVHTSGRGSVPEGDVVLLAVPDASIPEAARTVPSGRCVLHCSGTTPFEVLRPHRPAGSFHPLMTFPGPDTLPDLRGVPAAIAGDPEARERATTLAESLGMRAIEVAGDRRLYHASAVMAGNFATVLLAEAARVLEAAGVPREHAPALLAPLAIQSLKNAVLRGPAESLTGPVARGDDATLTGHREALHRAELEDLMPLYDAFVTRARALKSSG